MAAAYQNLYLEQGTTFNTTITVDDIYGNVYNLANTSAYSQIRKSYYSVNAAAIFTTSINANTGSIILFLDSHTTANISPGRYVYDTIIIDSHSNSVTRILEGTIDVSPCVTR